MRACPGPAPSGPRLRIRQDFVLRARQLHAGAGLLDLAEQRDLLSPVEHVAQEPLIEPDRAGRPAVVLQRRFEDGEAGAAGPLQRRVGDGGHHRDRGARDEVAQRDRCAAILVANRESQEEIFDGRQAGVREVLRPPRADALERRQRPLEHGRVGHWTMSASRGLHPDLANLRRQLERILEARGRRDSRGARVVTEHLLQHAARNGHARHRGGAEDESPDAIAGLERSVAVTGSRPVRYRIGSSMDEDRFARLTASRSTIACRRPDRHRGWRWWAR